MTQVGADDLGHPGVGLSLVMFAGELAEALRPTEFGSELPEQLVRVCEQTVTAANDRSATKHQPCGGSRSKDRRGVPQLNPRSASPAAEDLNGYRAAGYRCAGGDAGCQ
jgi:hypothetical protein